MGAMQYEENSYIKVETLLKEYSTCENPLEKSQLLGELLMMIKPMIVACCRHYYGKVEEDQIQDGFEKAINLINAYDPTLTDIKFLGYMKRMLMCYYWDMKRKDLKNPIREISEEKAATSVYSETGYQRIELEQLLNILTPREKEIIIKVYLQGKRQKIVAKELGLSLAYIKEALQKAKKKLRQVISI